MTGRRRPPTEAVAAVQTWGPEPIGSDQVYGLLRALGGNLAGFTSPTPAGWGLAGSIEETDSQLWASPQAFTGAAGLVAHSSYHVGGGMPIVFPADADYTFETVNMAPTPQGYS